MSTVGFEDFCCFAEHNGHLFSSSRDNDFNTTRHYLLNLSINNVAGANTATATNAAAAAAADDNNDEDDSDEDNDENEDNDEDNGSSTGPFNHNHDVEVESPLYHIDSR